MKTDINDTLRNQGDAAVRRHFENAKRYQSGVSPGVSDRPASFVLSSRQFVAGFIPPDYVLEGVLQRRFIYALTGKTGAGKTAIMLLLAALIALGKAIGDRAVEKGRVLYLAGENADDVCMRWIAMAQQIDFDIDEIDVYFIAGVFKLSEMADCISAELAEIGEITTLLIDTSAAFFEGDNENDNKQHGDHARRMRELTKVPG
jgi:RecA-family ATPase